MNSKTIFISLTTLAVILTACGPSAQPIPITQSTPLQDPLLLAAWNRLNDQTEPIQLWDGTSISGHNLAQFILDQAIPVLWKLPVESTKVAFSVIQCRGDDCTYGAPEKDAPPIVLSTALKDTAQIDEIVDVLAHEIFHRIQPYGHVIPTMYEEYTAYYVGAKLSGKMWADFETYNPLVPACLIQWFYDHLLLSGTYRDDQAYPLSVNEAVDTSDPICAASSGGRFTTPTAYKLSCTVTSENRFDCQFVIPSPTAAPESKTECKMNSLGLVECQTITLSTEQP